MPPSLYLSEASFPLHLQRLFEDQARTIRRPSYPFRKALYFIVITVRIVTPWYLQEVLRDGLSRRYVLTVMLIVMIVRTDPFTYEHFLLHDDDDGHDGLLRSYS